MANIDRFNTTNPLDIVGNATDRFNFHDLPPSFNVVSDSETTPTSTAPLPAANVPIHTNRFIGEVAGNILDQYDSPTYNMRLYFKKRTNVNTTTPSDTGDQESSEDSRSEQNTTGFQTSFVEPTEENIVVLAQTAVTGTTIDDVVIEHIIAAEKPFPTKISFTLTEPGGVSLMDQMLAAKDHLGLPRLDTSLYLDIVFKGYESDPDNNEAAGIPVVIAGPYTYEIGAITYGMSVNEAGSIYDFRGIIRQDIALLDTHYRIPEDIETNGIKISEHVAMYQEKLNQIIATKQADFTTPDSYVIDISGLVEGQGAEGVNAELVVEDKLLGDIGKTDRINRVFNDESTEIYDVAVDYVETQEGTEQSGETINIPESVKIIMKAGSTIEDFIGTLLSMNDDLFNRATRTVTPTDATALEVDLNKAHINWFKIKSDVQYLTFDDTRRAYTKVFHYSPIIYKEGRTDVGINKEEFRDRTEAEVQRAVTQLNIFKAYEYYFTGRNDQILNFDININEAYAVETLLADRGSFAAASAIANAPTLEANETNENTEQGQSTEAVTAKNKNRYTSILTDLASRDPDAFRNVVGNIANTLDLTDAERRVLIRNANRQDAEGLVDALSARAVSETLANFALQQRASFGQLGVPTSSDSGDAAEGFDPSTDYEPESSNFVYASALVAGLEGAEDLLNDPTSPTSSEDTESQEQDFQACIMPVDSSNQYDAATYERGTLRGPTTFSHLMDQHTSVSSTLLRLQMEVRGDPWYLGQETNSVPTEQAGRNTKESDVTGAIWDKGSNHLMLTIATPRRFDFDVTDEDNNTGLYDFSGLNFMVSGVYRMLTATSRFSGGQFTQSITGAKETAYPLNKLGVDEFDFEQEREQSTSEQDSTPTQSDNT